MTNLVTSRLTHYVSCNVKHILKISNYVTNDNNKINKDESKTKIKQFWGK